MGEGITLHIVMPYGTKSIEHFEKMVDERGNLLWHEKHPNKGFRPIRSVTSDIRIESALDALFLAERDIQRLLVVIDHKLGNPRLEQNVVKRVRDQHPKERRMP